MRRQITGVAAASVPRTKFAAAIRETFQKGYTFRDVRADLLAGLVVGVVALPLSMALAIATGVPPQYGLYTAIVGGAAIAILGGSRVQVSGPTAAFVVILAPISAKFGLAGLCMATVIAGLIMMIMGAAGLGKLMEFVPYPVTTGFTAGIAIVIATLQLRDFLGLTVEHMPDHYIERVIALARAGHTLRWQDLSIGLLTLAILIGLPRLTRRVPAPLVALPAAAALAALLSHVVPGFSVVTIATRFGGVPQLPPQPVLPWLLAGPDGNPLILDMELFRALLLPAVAIAMLGSIESLLSAVVADGMAGTKHDPDAELLAQGAGNILAPFFGGFAATGAIARTATNIRSGARSPLSAVFHSAFVLATVLVLAPALGYLPMTSLAALLLIVAWNMSELRHVFHVTRVAPRGDVIVLFTCLLLTVIFDMTISVTAGVLLAALMFMRRMAELTQTKLIEEAHAALPEPLPAGVLLYEVAGPLFFGAAQKAMSALKTVEGEISVVVLDLRSVPVMDATGLVNLEGALDRLHKSHIYTIIAGIQDQPLGLLARAGWKHRDWLSIYRSFEHGVEMARHMALLITPGTKQPNAA